jgi:hypothetical protein
MILILIAILSAITAYYYAKNEEKFDGTWVELLRWALVFVGWGLLGSEFPNLIISFLVTQAIYVPVYNYFSGKDIWFIDNDTWLGKQIINYLGEGAGRVWFFTQLAAAIALIIIF